MTTGIGERLAKEVQSWKDKSARVDEVDIMLQEKEEDCEACVNLLVSRSVSTFFSCK